MPEALYKLRPFQQEMVDKFMAVYDKYPNTLCGDDMGTGKTFEGMELDKRKRERDGRTGLKTLVLTTLGGTDVWTRHFRKFQPWIKTVTIDPKARGSFANSIYLEEADVYICHWDVIRMDEVKQALYYNHWFHIIGDELHRTKNRKAQVTQAFKRITCDHKTGLTGTPGDNNPQDLWSLLNWLYPKVWGSYWRFFDMYVDYKKHPVQGYKIIIGVRNEDHLLRVIEPYYIRRRFEEVVGDVPEKYYTPLYVDLTPRQRKAYNQMRDKDLAWVGENEDQPVPAPVVVTRLQRLQQFALAHVEVIETLKKRRNKWYDPKRKRIEWHADLGPPSARRVSDPRMNFPFWWEPVTVYKLIDPSAKLDYLMDLIKDMDLEYHPLVVFTQFRRGTALLSERLQKAKIPHGVILGDTPKPQRDKIVQDFQDGKLDVFIGTIGSCRESITLTRSHTAIFLDRAWSPSWNRQAEDRLRRIGQMWPVQIIDLIARNTVDLGRLTKYKLKWTWLQRMMGDKTFDYQEEHNPEGMAA